MKIRSSNLYVAVCVLILVFAATYFLLSDRYRMMESTRQNLLDGAVALQNFTGAVLEQSIESIVGVRADLEQPETAFNNAALRGSRDAMRFDPVSSYLGFRDIVSQRYFLMDRNGHLINSNLTRNLESKIPTPANSELQLYKVIQLPGDNNWYLPIALSVKDANGEVDMVFALVHVDKLVEGNPYFKTLPGSFFSLVTTDGRRLVRFHELGHPQDIDAPSIQPSTLRLIKKGNAGSVKMWSLLDKEEVIFGYSASASRPFIVVIGLPAGILTTRWLNQSITPMVVALIAIAFILFLGVKLQSIFSQLQAALEKYEYDANHDKLTGLLSRKSFIRAANLRLNKNLLECTNVILLNLNRFKDINDTMGSEAGDDLLVEVAKNLTHLTDTSNSLVARLGSDEFVIFASEEVTTRWLSTVLGTEVKAISLPMMIKGAELEVTASIGLSSFPADGQNTDELLRCASVALKQAKVDLRPVVHYAAIFDDFSPDMLELRADFLKALRSNSIELHYQPKIRMSDGALMGAEALSRWNHLSRGPIPPTKFIPIAENSELIHEFTVNVLHRALAQIKAWTTKGYRLPVAVNISVNNLLDQRFVDRLSNMLITHEIPAELLELEVTESAVMRYPELTLKTLHAIRALGVKLSIDDFGTGYASLAYLKQLPVQCLKIDKTFIDNLSTDEANQRIVKSAIHLAHEFSMIVVAEGVEQQSAAKILIDLGCELGQGYLYSKPLAPDLFEEIWLSNTLH